jgi:hypothetical protein
MLSINHQNDSWPLLGAIFFTISTFLVIDDNMTKANNNRYQK